MFDTTTEAIEDDLKSAEMSGVNRGQIALVRAQIRATLAVLTSPQIQTYTTTLEGRPAVHQTWDERITAAAEFIGWNPDELAELIHGFESRLAPADHVTAAQLDTDDALPVLVDTDDDPDVDFFAEARKARKK